MKQLIKLKKNFILPSAYLGLIITFCIGMLLLIFRIQTQYADTLINLRATFYDGVTVIGSPNNVWQYLIYAIVFSVLNGFAIWYIKKRFTKSEIQDIIVYWILGSSALTLSLLVYYLFLVLDINNIGS
jgi:hypothetical protein